MSDENINTHLLIKAMEAQSREQTARFNALDEKVDRNAELHAEHRKATEKNIADIKNHNTSLVDTLKTTVRDYVYWIFGSVGFFFAALTLVIGMFILMITNTNDRVLSMEERHLHTHFSIGSARSHSPAPQESTAQKIDEGVLQDSK